MASGAQGRRERDNNDKEERAHKERAKKSHECLQSLSVALGTREASRIAQSLSRWANPLHVQWKEVNEFVTTQMVKEIWSCSDAEISKGWWKVNRCTVNEIKDNAETIAMEAFGHSLHNHDAPLYFAKMLYMYFVLQRPVDFSSKDTPSSQLDIKASSITLSKTELQLALEGTKLESMEEKANLQKALEEKEHETQYFFEHSTPARATNQLQNQLEQMQQTMHQIAQSQSAPAHVLNLILHPEAVVPSTGASSSSSMSSLH